MENYNSKIEFERLLQILNYKERIIIVLFYLNDYSSKEISKILKMSENTVKSNLRRAKIKIKEKLGDEYYG
jgi:RNA polymerase sigma-70 factor (ECF subfamily)